jgi:isocitrate dehydrogenase kinase/phosphatase
MNTCEPLDSVAKLVTRVFDSYLSEFLIISRRAQTRFEERDWRGGRRDALERLSLYEKVLSQLTVQIESALGTAACDRSTWVDLKPIYARMVAGRRTADIAETFFNSITRKLMQTVGLDREMEFFDLENRPSDIVPLATLYRTYGQQERTCDVIRAILEDHRMHAAYEDLDRDIGLVANEMDLHLWPLIRDDLHYSVEVLKPSFFRNKVAYIVGRIVLPSRTLPLIIPLHNDESGLHIDSVLMEEADANNIFGFSYSYFQVEVEVPSELVGFLRSILPHKPVSDLYNAIGFYKHGKTVFYRDLHQFVHVTKERFVIAPGREGAVMTVFTLPNYSYVFKVIKDRPCFLRSGHLTDKSLDKAEVMRRYRFVCHRDRVGRLVDTQEFENVKFRTKRYSGDLLKEFEMAARDLVSIGNGYVVIHHLYLQRKVIPLPMYFMQEKNPEAIRHVVVDFGYFIKDLAATGLFPADLFNTWNYGVSENNRVVLFDYDDVIALEDARFRHKPGPRNEYEEMNPEEEWIVAEPTDFFLDEIDTFVGIPQPLRGIFNSVHRDLFTFEFWEKVKEKVGRGDIIDTIAYNREKRFRRTAGDA